MHHPTHRIAHTMAFVKSVHEALTGTNNSSTSLNGKEGNILFNDALNTFYLRLYGVSISEWMLLTT